MRKNAFVQEHVVFGGGVRYYRNPEGVPFGGNDACIIENTWDDLESMEDAWKAAFQRERAYARKTPPAWNARFGYLSPIPTHCGNALEFSGVFHLEGLHLLGELEPTLNAMFALRMAANGVNADGLHNCAHVFHIQTDAMLGVTERQMFMHARRVFSDLSRQELSARYRLVHELPLVLLDSMSRALAVLKECVLLSRWELMDLLSPVRLGCSLGFIDGITLKEADTYLKDQFLHGIVEPPPDSVAEEDARDNRDNRLARKINRRFGKVSLSAAAKKELR